MPGLMALTRILRGPSSLASERVTASTAALVALYTEALGGAAVLATELILTMLPPAAPDSARCLAMDAPIPFDAPVTMATFPSSLPSSWLMRDLLLGA